MTTYKHDDDSVVVIVGSGAGGGTLANELCQKGIPVVLLEAGARQSQATFINDEWPSFNQLSWNDIRTSTGTWRIARDFPNLPAWICKAVGGTTTHWAGASLRIQEHEFHARETYGELPDTHLLDWPLTLAELEPYYARAEDKMSVTRTGRRTGLPGNNNFKVMHAGARKLGYRYCSTGPMAIDSKSHDDSPPHQQLDAGCQDGKIGAKWSTLCNEIPAAEATGHLELRAEAHVLRIEHDARGHASGVVYADAKGHLQCQKARVVAIAGNAIETPRLLLNSASALFPHGLGNGSGMVGKYYMRHTTGSVFAEFDDPVHFYRGTIMAGIISDESRNDPSRGFVGGYEMETISLGLPFMAAFFNPGAWGRDFSRVMDSYTHLAGMWLVGEDMPRDSNRITLNENIRDAFGMPVANVHYDDHPNDVAMREHAFRQGEALYRAVGAKNTHRLPPYPSTHNLGTCRMSAREADGVVNKYGQSHELPNLFISDGSQFTTSAAENPTLTIVGLAIRQAEFIAESLRTRTI
ncbi:2-keto-gluconate dehydrogenase [Stutzerimonas kirkiae]|uniref:2-keto-gluconate dehydrogenase n=1 Tax=Stutzerimonas kirkiae TaxID=2211392 RepID=A0A4V2KD95_9GAMM|nr:GMC family oxidoreductase [Stutzerimonas kirkiae]TBU98101.1 2-keto-gluconate dehydrogenase [Stutzerimonas kirkiae]TBV02384.1 2-keto-gluconate dehydrogenase [Stutzerimonas kirkiae]